MVERKGEERRGFARCDDSTKFAVLVFLVYMVKINYTHAAF